MRAAVIGYGSIGPTHRAALAADDRIEQVVVWDHQPRRLARVEDPAARLPDAEAIWNDPDIALVTLATPHPGHADLCRRALAAGKHVWCEKPLGVLPDQVAGMQADARLAADQGLVWSGVFQHRFSPLAGAVRELLGAGTFGPLRETSMEFACQRNAAYFARDPWRGSWEGEGGSLLINQAIHTLDLWLWMLDRVPESVSGRVENRWTAAFNHCEDLVEGSVLFADGLRGRLHAVNEPDRDRWHSRCRFVGERGTVVYDSNHGGRLVEIDHDDPGVIASLRHCQEEVEALRARPALPGKACYGDLHAVQCADVISAIIDRRPPRVDFASAAVANQVALAFYHATMSEAPAPVPVSGYRQPTLSHLISTIPDKETA